MSSYFEKWQPDPGMVLIAETHGMGRVRATYHKAIWFSLQYMWAPSKSCRLSGNTAIFLPRFEVTYAAISDIVCLDLGRKGYARSSSLLVGGSPARNILDNQGVACKRDLFMRVDIGLCFRMERHSDGCRMSNQNHVGLR